jgi:hypothetical protein
VVNGSLDFVGALRGVLGRRGHGYRMLNRLIHCYWQIPKLTFIDSAGIPAPTGWRTQGACLYLTPIQ